MKDYSTAILQIKGVVAARTEIAAAMGDEWPAFWEQLLQTLRLLNSASDDELQRLIDDLMRMGWKSSARKLFKEIGRESLGAKSVGTVRSVRLQSVDISFTSPINASGYSLRQTSRELLAGLEAPSARPEAAPPVPEVPFEPPSRYADFTFFYDEEKRRVPDGYVLQVDRWYQLEIAVRITPIGIPFEELERLPIREPQQVEDVTIMVAAEGDGFEIAEPVQTLTLPPMGDSTENAWLRVRPLRQSANSSDLSKIRVRLYYEFNLIEMVVIHTEVVGKFDGQTQSKLGMEKPILFRQEKLERDYIDFDNIQPRTMHIDITRRGDCFLFNFAFKNDIEQKLVFTAPAHLLATDLEDALVCIRKIWYDIAMNKTFTKQLQGNKNEFLKHIRKLAKAGRRLWIKLFKQERKSSMYKIGTWLEKHPLPQDGIIQISLNEDAANFVFPWALIYDRPVPRKTYELPNLDGFWGIRYSIEQHLPKVSKGTDEPIHLDDTLKMGFMLWDEFRNANEEKLLMKTLMTKSMGRLEITTPPITDADRCYDLLGDCNVHMLYFYTHGYTRHRHTDVGVGQNFDLFLRYYEGLATKSPLRELYRVLYQSIKRGDFEDDQSWIELSYGKLYLDELYDYIKRLDSNPLVILNMCESSQITPSLSESFIHFFLDRGAKGVIGTECPMTIEFAHPFAERFLQDILEGKQVGMALLNARRHFLEFKNPLGLAYTLFGLATISFKPPVI